MLSLSLKNYNITYNRVLSRNWDVGAGLTFMPSTQTPFASELYDFITGYDPETEEGDRNKNNPILNLSTKGYSPFVRARYFFPYKEIEEIYFLAGLNKYKD